MIILFFVGCIIIVFLYFRFLTNLFNVLTGTTHSLLQSHNVKKILWPWILKPMMKVTDCTPGILNDINLVVITTSSVYCCHKKTKTSSKPTNQTSNFQTIKANKKSRKEPKNKQTKISQGSNLGPLDVESLVYYPSAKQIPILNQEFKYLYDQI